MRPSASYWIKKLELTGHIEGGYFREVYRSELVIDPTQLPAAFAGKKHLSTSIYFLLEQGQFSSFHRIASDEQWHFYFGDPLIVYEINSSGTCVQHLLGNDPEKGESFQCVIEAGSWFASRPAPASEYCLVGCTVAPGFDFEDFELADRDRLSEQFPQHHELITSLT